MVSVPIWVHTVNSAMLTSNCPLSISIPLFGVALPPHPSNPALVFFRHEMYSLASLSLGSRNEMILAELRWKDHPSILFVGFMYVCEGMTKSGVQ